MITLLTILIYTNLFKQWEVPLSCGHFLTMLVPFHLLFLTIIHTVKSYILSFFAIRRDLSSCILLCVVLRCFLSRWMVRKGIPRVCFYFCSTERNSELFSLPRKGSERKSERFLFRGTAGIQSEITTICFVYSVFRGIIFLSAIPNPNCTERTTVHISGCQYTEYCIDLAFSTRCTYSHAPAVSVLHSTTCELILSLPGAPYVFQNMAYCSSSESVVINDFHAKTGAWEGAGQLLIRSSDSMAKSSCHTLGLFLWTLRCSSC
jgi:hypothetical protein